MSYLYNSKNFKTFFVISLIKSTTFLWVDSECGSLKTKAKDRDFAIKKSRASQKECGGNNTSLWISHIHPNLA